MKVKQAITFILLCLVLISCSKENIEDYGYTFSGESNHWVAEYTIAGTEEWGEKDEQITYDHDGTYEFILTYKGDIEELSAIKEMEYGYDAISSGLTIKRDDPPTEKVIIERGNSVGRIYEYHTIKVHVILDDEEESFELTVNSK